MNLYDLINGISNGAFDEQLRMLYGTGEKAVLRARARYLSAAESFSRLHPECGEIHVYSASGRTEIGGNHTDHQRGKVLTGSVDLDAIACAAPNGSSTVHIYSEGYGLTTVDISSLDPVKEEENTTKLKSAHIPAIKTIQEGKSELKYYHINKPKDRIFINSVTGEEIDFDFENEEDMYEVENDIEKYNEDKIKNSTDLNEKDKFFFQMWNNFMKNKSIIWII